MNFFSNKYLAIAMMAALASSVFTSCTKDEDDYYTRFDGDNLFTTDVPSVVTMPYVTINNQFDMSVIDDRVYSLYCDFEASDTLHGISFATAMLPMKNTDGKFSFSVEGLTNHVVYKYNANAYIVLTDGDPWQLHRSSKDEYFKVDIDEEAMVVTGDPVITSHIYLDQQVYKVTISCQINMPAEHLKNYTTYIYCSSAPDDKDFGFRQKVTLDANGHGTCYFSYYTPYHDKLYYQAILVPNNTITDVKYKGVMKSFTISSE